MLELIMPFVYFTVGIVTGYLMWGRHLARLHKGIRAFGKTLEEIKGDIDARIHTPPTYEARDDD